MKLLQMKKDVVDCIRDEHDELLDEHPIMQE